MLFEVTRRLLNSLLLVDIFGLSTFVTSQCVGSSVSIPPQIRNNCDFIVSFSLFAEPDRKILIERFGSVTTKKEGEALFKKITQQEYSCCVFDTTKVSANKLEDMMFSYKAPEKIPKFIIGRNKPEKIINKEFTVEKGKKKHGLEFRFEGKDNGDVDLNDFF